MGCALGEVRDLKQYVTGLEVSPKRRCSNLEGLKINSQSSDHLELATKELWRTAACFRGGGGEEFKKIGQKKKGNSKDIGQGV